MKTITILILFAAAVPVAASPIRRDERVVFFDTAAHLSEDGSQWTLPIRGWVHELEGRALGRLLVEEVLREKYGLAVDAASRDNFNRRVRLLLADNEADKEVRVRVGERLFTAVSGDNGHFRIDVTMTAEQAGALAGDGIIPVRAELGAADRRVFSGKVHLVGKSGTLVISDLDDTVKITHVTDHKKMLESTFLRDFEAVPEMAKRFREWAEGGASIHFVSSSPWHLYEPINEFLDRAGFPPRVLHLKTVRIKDETIFELFKPGTATKPPRIESVLNAFPGRSVILVGDDGEQDPEVYAGIHRRFPERVSRILIRNVLFENIPTEKWEMFRDGASIAP